jgi:hypothetical protein
MMRWPMVWGLTCTKSQAQVLFDVQHVRWPIFSVGNMTTAWQLENNLYQTSVGLNKILASCAIA